LNLNKPTNKKQIGNQKSLQYAEYKPNQLTGTIDTGFFSSKSFILFASQYQLDGESQQKMCDINMKVAENAGELEVARFWKIIKLFVTEQRELGLSEVIIILHFFYFKFIH